MKKKSTATILSFPGKRRGMSAVSFLLAVMILSVSVFSPGKIYGQIGLADVTPVTENFDGMGTSTTNALMNAPLSSNWKVQNAGAPTWAGGIFNVGQQASSGAPGTGASYNWGSSTTERALGVMTSGGYPSPTSAMAWYRNTNASNLISLTIAFDLERYRINSAAASLTFFYSTNGSSWTGVAAGDIAAALLPTGTSAFDYNPTGTPSATNAGKISKSGISITGLNIATNGNIYLRWNLVTTGANSQAIAIDNVSVTAGFATPAIVLSDNALSGFTYMVGAGPSVVQTFTISGANLAPAAGNLTVTGPVDYEISSSNAPFTPAAGGTITLPYTGGALAVTTIYARLKAGLAVNPYVETITCSGGGATSESITCNGSVTNFFNSLSDVVAVAASEAAAVSSTVNTNAPLTSGTGVQVWSFTIRDGGGSADADNLPTIVNSISLIGLAGDGNAVGNWAQAIKTVSLFDGAALIATGTVGTNQIDFTGMTLTVPDNTNKTITMRLSLNCGIGGANFDGDDFVFRLSNTNFTTASSATSSQKSSFAAAVSANGSNVIAVVATRLIFTIQPTNVGVNASISPTVIITATDLCGNKDLNYTGTVNITSTGTLTNTQSEAAISGVATFPAISFSMAGTSLTLTAAASGLTSVISNPFDVTTTTVLNPGDLMIVGFDTYTNNSVTPGEDKISIANFVPLLPGTEFSIANMVYENTAAANVATGRWYNGNGTLSNSPPYITIKYNGGTSLAKGSVICITIAPTGGVTNISVNGVTSALFSVPVPSSFVQLASDNPDAFFLMQGTFSADQAEGVNLYKTFTGTVFGAIQIRGSFQPFSAAGNAGGTRVSRIYPTLGCISISMPGGTGTSVAYYGYYKPTASGGLHTGTQHDLISSIGNISSNWVTAIAGLGVDDLATTNTCSNTFTVTSGVAYGYWTGTVASKDWYDCANWDNFAVPDATINVTIDGTALNDCQIAATSPKAAQFGNKGDAKSITIVGRKLIIENTGATINRLDVAGNITINTANGLDMSDGTAAQDGIINVKGNWINNFSNGFDPGQSEINFNGTAAAQTITVPDGETFYNFTNSNTSGGVILANGSANVTVTNQFSLSNGILTLNTNTLTLNGTAIGSGTITGSNTSNLIIGGIAGGNLGTLNFTSGSRLLNNITLNRTGALAAATLGTDLSINTLATITSGILNAGTNSFAGAGNLTMTGGELQVGRPGVTSPELNGTYYLTAGVVNFTGTGSQTIRAVNYYDLTSTSTGARIMANAGTVGIANTFTKGANAYTFTGSTVDYNGTTANQNVVPFTAAAAPGSTYDNLTLSNSLNTVTTKTLTGATDVEGDLTLNNSIGLRLGANYLNLKSTATKTARVAPVSSGASIDYSLGAGRFVVERYFPGRRKWRLITAPVTVDAGKTIFNSWQVGGTSPSGSGTYVTGPSPSAANGLDVSPQNNYSLRTYNPLAGVWDGVSNTNSKLISGTVGGAGVPDNVGYLMFIRGDRTPANVNAFNSSGTVLQTTLRDTGKIQVQSYDFPGNAVVGQYAVIGNPYASPVDFGSASVVKSGIANKFYAWDPNINGANGVGGYVIIDLALGTTTTIPVGQTGVTQTQIIQSKQAFLIQTNGASPKITFNEAAKSSANNLAVFRPVPATIASMAINLHSVAADGTTILSDGLLEQFRNDFSNGVDYLDGIKFANINETFNIQNGSTAFMLERRKPVQAGDTIFLSLKRTKQAAYRFNFILNNMPDKKLIAYLADSYLNKYTPVTMQGDTWIDFNVTADAATAAPNRFYVVFKRAIRFKNLLAGIIASDVVVKWAVDNAAVVDRYEVERSADGVVFEKIGEVEAGKDGDALNEYSLADLNPAPGIYYYRVKAVSSAYDVYDYTETVKVKVAKNGSQLYVFPNPVTENVIGVKMSAAMPAGMYTIRLVNGAGQGVFNTRIQHNKAAGTELINYPSFVTAGTYQLEVTGPDKKRSVVNVVIVRR